MQFTLVVDNFGVKYLCKEHVIYLQKVPEEHFKITTNKTDKKYIGITLDGDYKQWQVHLSMTGYVNKALKQSQHILQKHQDSPF